MLIKLQHEGSLIVACRIKSLTGDRTRAPLSWEGGVLAAEPPGKSLQMRFKRVQHDLAFSLKNPLCLLPENIRDDLGRQGCGGVTVTSGT